MVLNTIPGTRYVNTHKTEGMHDRAAPVGVHVRSQRDGPLQHDHNRVQYIHVLYQVVVITP